MGYLLSLSKSATILALDISGWALLIGGVVLVVGLWGEIKLPHWHHRLKTFERMVFLGVCVELLADGGIFLFTSHLQTILDAESAALGNAMALAQKAAAEANARSKEFDSKIAA